MNSKQGRSNPSFNTNWTVESPDVVHPAEGTALPRYMQAPWSGQPRLPLSHEASGSDMAVDEPYVWWLADGLKHCLGRAADTDSEHHVPEITLRLILISLFRSLNSSSLSVCRSLSTYIPQLARLQLGREHSCLSKVAPSPDHLLPAQL